MNTETLKKLKDRIKILKDKPENQNKLGNFMNLMQNSTTRLNFNPNTNTIEFYDKTSNNTNTSSNSNLSYRSEVSDLSDLKDRMDIATATSQQKLNEIKQRKSENQKKNNNGDFTYFFDSDEEEEEEKKNILTRDDILTSAENLYIRIEIPTQEELDDLKRKFSNLIDVTSNGSRGGVTPQIFNKIQTKIEEAAAAQKAEIEKEEKQRKPTATISAKYNNPQSTKPPSIAAVNSMFDKAAKTAKEEAQAPAPKPKPKKEILTKFKKAEENKKKDVEGRIPNSPPSSHSFSSPSPSLSPPSPSPSTSTKANSDNSGSFIGSLTRAFSGLFSKNEETIPLLTKSGGKRKTKKNRKRKTNKKLNKLSNNSSNKKRIKKKKKSLKH
jgi:hypothetical protein